MNTNKNLTPGSRLTSFDYAFTGLKHLFKAEPNAQVHAVATIVVIALGFIRDIDRLQWLAIVFAIGLVWITEALNTCIEKLCDFACKQEIHPAIKIIKDIAAGAVMISAVISVVVAALVFID